SGDVSLGDTLTYSFVTTNDGDVTLDNVTVTDPMAGLSALTCVPVAGSSLAPGAAMTCSATYSVTQTDVDNGQVDNTATVNATDPNAAPVTDVDSESVVVSQNPSISLVKSLSTNADEDASGDVSLGDTLTYSFVTTNDGDVTLDNVAITDPLAGLSALSCVPAAGATLAPAAAMTCSATYSVTQGDVDNGQIDNTATVNATDPNAAPVSDVDSETVVAAQNPSISLVKSLSTNADEDASGDVSLGDTLTYGFMATNDGDVTLDNVTVTDPLAGLSALSCVPAAGSSLAPGAAMTCSATYSVTQTDVDNGQIDNTATVNATDPNAAPISDIDSATVPVPQLPSIDLVKSLSTNADEDASGDVSLGDTLTYSFVATNDGNVTLDGFVVSDPLAGLSALSCAPAAGSSLAPGAAMTCSATYSVTQTNVDNGVILNTATADATDPNGAPVTATDDETVPVAQLEAIGLAKALTGVVNNGDGTYLVNFALVVENLGSVTVTDLAIYDDVVTIFAATSPSGFTATDGTLLVNPTWDGTAASNILQSGQTLLPGESGTAAVSFIATPDAVTRTDNQASAEALPPSAVAISDDSQDGPDPDPDDDSDPSNNGDPTPVDFLEAPLLGVAKEVSAGPTSNGDGSFDVTYAILVSNDGDVLLDGVQLVDDLSLAFPGVGSLTVVSLTSSDLTVSTTYDGVSDLGLLAGTDTLSVGASGTISLTVALVPGSALGPYENTAVGTGTSPGGTAVTDDSQDGSDPDSDGNGNPGDNSDPTPVTFPALGTITGVVWLDFNGDGSIDPGETAIPGVRVVLSCAGLDGVLGTSDDVEVGEASTAGTYTFTDVPAGDCSVAVDVSSLPADLQETFDIDGGLDSIASVTVTAGGNATDVDFGYAVTYDLELIKTDSGDVRPGDTLTYSLLVTNLGPGLGIGPLELVDNLPAGLEIVSVAGTDWVCDVAGLAVTCAYSNDLPDGASSEIVIVTTVIGGEGTVLTNSATVVSSGPLGEITTVNNTDAVTRVVSALPVTGFEISSFLRAGVLMIVLGALILVLARRKEDDPSAA
ncbi:MAG: DUF11 domain-containing protein, partial [bacterium]|nr:DUF11 domain-containing protein [bacterium]